MDRSAWPIAAGTVRPVLWRMLLNKRPLIGCENVEVHSTNHRKASTFTARFAWSADPAAVATWLDTDPPLLTEVQVAFPTASGAPAWQSYFIGEANDVHFNPVSGDIEVSGRDLAGRLIDGKTRETFRNNSGSEIAAIIAARFGLTVDVDPTTERAGAYYQLEHDKLTADAFSKTTSYWDLLCFLAHADDRDLWVDGNTLHYKKSVDIQSSPAVNLSWTARSTSNAYPSAPVISMGLRRSLVLSKGVKVVVKIWNAKGKSSTEITYPSGAAKDAQEYTYVKPGWSPQKALEFAQSVYKDIIGHERVVDLETPGSTSITARSVVSISGLPGTTFNVRYAVDELTSEFMGNAGFVQHATLKNHSVQSSAEVG